MLLFTNKVNFGKLVDILLFIVFCGTNVLCKAYCFTVTDVREESILHNDQYTYPIEDHVMIIHQATKGHDCVYRFLKIGTCCNT